MASTKTYQLRDCSTDEIVFVGLAAECAEFLGVALNTFRWVRSQASTANKPAAMKGFYLEEVDTNGPSDFWGLDAAAIRAWDAFTEPLREKFGIPKWTPPKED